MNTQQTRKRVWNETVFVVLVLCFFVVGCDSPRNEEFAEWIHNVTNQFKAKDIKAAVVPLFSNYVHSAMVRIDDLPAEVINVFLAKPYSYQPTYAYFTGTTTGKPEDRVIDIFCGSGFGHWGIIVSPFGDNQEFANSLNAKVVRWEAGLYFFLDN